MFRIGITRDFLNPQGRIDFGDIGLARLDAAPGVAWEFLPEHVGELTAAHAAQYDGLLVLAPRVMAMTLAGQPRLAIVARFGVGYDNVDTEACTRAGVALTITPDGVRRPVAASVLTFVLALSHKLLIKDRLTRAGLIAAAEERERTTLGAFVQLWRAARKGDYKPASLISCFLGAGG